MNSDDRAVYYKKIKLIVLMAVVVLLTLANDSEDCCPNPEDGQQSPELISMNVVVTPSSAEVEAGTDSFAVVLTECSSVAPCPPVLQWDLQTSGGLQLLDTQPDAGIVYFQASGDLLKRKGLRLADYNPSQNRLEKWEQLRFSPVLDPVSAEITSISGGTAEVLVFAWIGEPQIADILNEGALLHLGSEKRSFGSVTVGFWKRIQVIATNLGTETLYIDQVAFAGEDSDEFSFGLADSVYTLNPGAGITIPVTFSPTSEGSKTANISIRWRTDEGPGVNFDFVTFNGTGIAPE